MTPCLEHIVCGQSHPDSEIEARTHAHRITLGMSTEPQGCGQEMHWTLAYRCVECARWFHHDCIKHHFALHQDHT